MRRIFLDDVYENEITRKGYTVIRAALNDATCTELEQYYMEHTAADDRPFTISNWTNDNENRSATFSFIANKLNTVAAAYLADYKPVMGVFTIKKPHAQSEMLLHQDWSLVDESQYRSVSIWAALCDMTNENGYLQVAEGSHIYCSYPRGMNVPVPFEDIRSEMHQHALTGIPLKKGDVIVFEHRLIHASPPNNSNKIRLAAVSALIPQEAAFMHYYKKPDNDMELEVLQMEENRFHLLNFFDAPNRPEHIKILHTVPATFRQISMNEVNGKLHGAA